MNIKKLLATTAIAALAATSASALGIDAADVDATAGNSVNAILNLATELASASGQFEYLVTTTNEIPAGDAVLTIQLPAGVTFDGAVVLGTNAIVAASTAALDAVSISSGGADGDSSVAFIITPTTGGGAAAVGGTTADIELTFDLIIDTATACAAPGAIKVGLATITGLAIEAGGDGTNAPISSAANLLACNQGLDLTAVADAGDSVLALPDFTAVDTAVAGDTALGTGTQATLGTVTLTVDPDADATAALGATDDPIAAADVNSVTFSVTFVDAAGIDAVDVAGNTGTKTGNVFAFDLDGAGITALFGGAQDVTADINSDPTGPTVGFTPVSIPSQSVTISDVTIGFAPVTFGADEVFTGGALDALQHEGTVFGPFNWVGDATKASRNIFRFTGINGTSVPVEVSFNNSSAGASFDAISGTVTLTVVNGEGQLSSTDLAAVNPGFGRSDVTFTFFSDQTTADVDRLMLRSGVLSTFGGGANNTP